MQSLVLLFLACAAVATVLIALVRHLGGYSGTIKGDQRQPAAKGGGKMSQQSRTRRDLRPGLSPLPHRLAGNARLEARKPWGW